MVAIRNGRGLRASDISSGRQDAYAAGQPLGLGRDIAYSNPALAQISTLTLAEQADVSDEIVEGQVWTITLTDPDGVAYATSYTLDAADAAAGTDAEGLAYMAGQLAAAMEANTELDNIVDAAASGAVITVTWKHPDAGVWTIAAVCAPAVAETVLLATAATSQTAGGTTLPMARFVTLGTPAPEGPGGPGRRASLPSASTDTIMGVALRDFSQVRPFDTAAGSANAWSIGSIVSVREGGEVAMTNVSSTAAVAGGPVYAVVSTTGGDALGEARADQDGVADVWTITPNAVNDAVYGLSIHFPEWNGQSARTFVVPPVTADGSATATEIVTALTASIATVAELPSLLTTSGTTTLILTGADLGRPFTVYDSAEAGDYASITNTTPAVPYTVRVPGARWTAPVAAGAIGPLYVSA